MLGLGHQPPHQPLTLEGDGVRVVIGGLGEGHPEQRPVERLGLIRVTGTQVDPVELPVPVPVALSHRSAPIARRSDG